MNTKRQTKTSSECKICGEPAIYSYFGVISCQACKVFFRRNAERGLESLKCVFDGSCEVNVNTRHVCTYCRLSKCFSSGMQTEMIRSPLSKTNKINQKRKITSDRKETRSTALVRSNEFEQLPTLNLLRSDKSTLTVDQWNLISNISHCYDEHAGFSIAESFMHEQDKLPIKLRFKPASVKILFEVIFGSIQSLYTTNQDFLSLSVNDRSILLCSTLAHTSALSPNYLFRLLGFFNSYLYYETVAILSHPSAVPFAKRLADHLDFDIIIMKMFLAILSFSTVRYTFYSNALPINLSNIKQILHIQDTYIELLWRYLLYKFNYERTVMVFSDLLRCFFAVHECIVQCQDVQWYVEKINSIVDMTEETLSLSN